MHHGLILPKTHPFWQKTTRLMAKCRCEVQTLRADEIEKRAKNIRFCKDFLDIASKDWAYSFDDNLAKICEQKA